MNIGKINPATLKITDMRFADIDGAPKRCTLVKLYTNQGLVGYGEVRDASSKTSALMLKSRLLGENPCDIDRIFRKIRTLGTHARGAGGVSGIEIALWDIAAKAYGIPVFQMLGGKYYDKVRVYCDTDIDGKPDGRRMGEALQAFLAEVGITLGSNLLIAFDYPGVPFSTDSFRAMLEKAVLKCD